ncbi:uncharacterized protein LOC121832723 [Peromyscus maniculatus bairdii]|uniref:uncharacterized protein LOC121832723 n=1 Tax=Peromyscus maniculatus bairdii TaxID=230844 RepID=UPI003FCF6E6A
MALSDKRCSRPSQGASLLPSCPQFPISCCSTRCKDSSSAIFQAMRKKAVSLPPRPKVGSAPLRVRQAARPENAAKEGLPSTVPPGCPREGASRGHGPGIQAQLGHSLGRSATGPFVTCTDRERAGENRDAHSCAAVRACAPPRGHTAPPPPSGALTERARALAHKASAARARPPRPRPPARSRKCARAALPSGRPLLSKCELPIERRGWPRAPMSPALSAAASPAPGAASAQSAAPPGRLRPAAAVPSRHRAASRAPTDERAGTRGARARAGPRLVCCLPARRRAGRTRAAQGPRCPPAPRSAPTTRAPPRLDPLPGHAPSCSRPGPPLPSPARTRDCASATPWRGDPGRSPLGGAAHPRGALPGWLPRPQADSERGAPGLSTAGAGAADPGPGAGQRPSRGSSHS